MSKAITDEQIIAALISAETVGAAADKLKISRRTIYDRMSSSKFQALYQNARNDILRTAVYTLNKNLQRAIEVTAEIMQAEDTNPATRLQAAQTIISNAGKFTERLTIAEQRNKEQTDDSMFDILSA